MRTDPHVVQKCPKCGEEKLARKSRWKDYHENGCRRCQETENREVYKALRFLLKRD